MTRAQQLLLDIWARYRFDATYGSRNELDLDEVEEYLLDNELIDFEGDPTNPDFRLEVCDDD